MAGGLADAIPQHRFSDKLFYMYLAYVQMIERCNEVHGPLPVIINLGEVCVSVLLKNYFDFHNRTPEFFQFLNKLEEQHLELICLEIPDRLENTKCLWELR